MPIKANHGAFFDVRRLDGSPLNERTLDGVLNWRIATWTINVFQKVVDCPLAHRVMWQFHSGKGRVEVSCYDFLVVEGHNGNISWNRKIELAQRVICAHCHTVIETKQCGRSVG